MKKIVLGKTGLKVTELCFGALPMGPAQKNMPVADSTKVVEEALLSGINFIDTAEIYRTYEPIKLAMKSTGIRPIIATKSPALTYEGMEKSINEALSMLDVEYIDIFLLHAARAELDVFEVRGDALKCLIDYKNKGVIKAVGISTHSVGVVNLAADNPAIDIIFPILNQLGMGILNGNLEEMEAAIEKCFENNKGVYIMKALAGGNLIHNYAEAVEYVRDFAAERAPVAIEMVSVDEVRMNVDYFNGKEVSITSKETNKKFLIVPTLCKLCGKCIDTCHSGVISMGENYAVIDNENCLCCGYCVTVCPQFAIRMI
jgi:Predicted oxidoreductases (related to aryl-alcohol dehydrogenases)